MQADFEQKRRNRRLAGILVTIAAVFMFGFVARFALFGH